MVPVKTSIDDIEKVLGYMSRQVGWVESSKAEKALGNIDDRKLSAMVEFGLLLRDGGNIKVTPRGQTFSTGDQTTALREVLASIELYRSTLEWIHYAGKAEVTATEIGQYWESTHTDTLGNLRGSTLKDGAVCFGRVVEGAGLGAFTLGRGGKETRVVFLLGEVANVIDNHASSVHDAGDAAADSPAAASPSLNALPPAQRQGDAFPLTPAVSVSASPSVHVNVEIHIAADATADTVKEIFRNMARYVLDKPINDDL